MPYSGLACIEIDPKKYTVSKIHTPCFIRSYCVYPALDIKGPKLLFALSKGNRIQNIFHLLVATQ